MTAPSKPLKWIPVFEGRTERARMVRDQLRYRGLRARYFDSPYIGHHAVEVAGATRAQIKKALHQNGEHDHARLLRRDSYGCEF